MVLIPILISIGIVLLTAFYVAAEISIAGSRRSRIQQLHEEGNRLAGLVSPIIENPSQLSAYISSCQISITLCSIALGFVGQGSLADRLVPVVTRWGAEEATASSISVALVLVTLSVSQVFFGELIPKNVGVRIPESLAMATIQPLRAYHAMFTPLLRVFNLANTAILKLFGLEVTHEHGMVLTPTEIRHLARESQAGGQIQRDEHQWIDSTLRFDEMPISRIMTPRQRIFAAPDSLTVTQWTRLLVHSPYSRMPLFGETLDSMTGLVHLRDSLCHEAGDAGREDLMGEIHFLPHSLTVDEGMRWMQKNRVHMVMVRDESDRVVGLTTLEELVEAVVGDIEDEFDTYLPAYRFLNRDRIWLDGTLPLPRLAMFLDCDEAELRAGLEAQTAGGDPNAPLALPYDLRMEHGEGDEEASSPSGYSVRFEVSLLERLRLLRTD